MVPSDCSDQGWSPSPSQSTYHQPPAMEIGIECQNKPPVRLKRASLHPQAHIGIKCQEKPPVRLKSVSAATQPARNMAKNAVSGVRPEEEPQGSIWFLTQAILLFPQHPPAMDNSSQQEDRIPISANHASMCFRPSHAKIGIGCADKPPVRLKSSRSTGWIETWSS